MSFAAKGVRILLVGDDGVGKTSLILSLVTEEFPEDVPPRAEEITIPADVTPEKVPTHIVDFSNADQTEDELRAELELADVVCVVYACNDEESVARITSYWLPVVFEVCSDHRKPVVLVGNKSDLVETEGAIMNELLGIMDEYPEVETCIECSAYDLKNISELFYYAQKAVLHPTAPLYSHDEQQLTEKCQEGLIRIFKICDLDNDGVLNDLELNEFQKRCFRNSLPTHGLQEVKNIVQRNMDEGVTDVGVTLPGFLFLHTLFIQKGRQETTWTALRRFGYGDNLEIKEDYLVPTLHIAPDSSVELSSTGLDFVMELFYKYDQDEDDALSPEELQNLVSLCPQNPWSQVDFTATCCNDQGWITAEGFVAQWILWSYMDYTWTLTQLAYFGFIHDDLENQLTGLRVTRSKDVDHQKRKTTRSVFLAYVVGPPGVGKTSFLQSFLNKNISDNKEIKQFSKYSINSVQLRKHEVHVILEEIPFELAEEKLLAQKHDTTCYLYDVTDTNSFAKIAELHKKINLDKTPSIFIGTKSDLSTVKQNFEVPPNEYAFKNSPFQLQFFSSLENNIKYKNVYTKIATLANHTGGSYSSETSVMKLALTVGLSITVLAGVGFIAYRYLRKGASNTS
ncbi:mitochondrial Rho GTPase 1-A-like [Hydractinia symbiolongicarpus]|uniref:mitochondrial Rho GTPase 1-A-like n=1 Tax=Hydractinia symbiolongicarpus TaxID=13093 RepID=UPI00254C4E9B|nr:mitochondrial Rho GTPase 1-A-like [Hydractinia symbiolongicarpus]